MECDIGFVFFDLVITMNPHFAKKANLVYHHILILKQSGKFMLFSGFFHKILYLTGYLFFSKVLALLNFCLWLMQHQCRKCCWVICFVKQVFSFYFGLISQDGKMVPFFVPFVTACLLLFSSKNDLLLNSVLASNLFSLKSGIYQNFI